MKGEIVALHLFDVGGTFDLSTLQRALANRGSQRAPSVGKGTPAYVEFPQPLVVAWGTPLPLEGPAGFVPADVTLLYFPIGAVSVRFRIPIDVENLSDLSDWANAVVRLDGERVGLKEAARALMERERALWEPAVRDRYTDRVFHEGYTIFAFSDVGAPAEAFLESHGRDVAGLLKGERGDRLHEKEVKEGLKKWFSYYADDVVVVDWDAAFLIDPTPEYEDLVFVLEIANLQLLQFRAFDAYLDDLLERAYDELQALFRRPSVFRNVRRTVHELALVRMEIAELADEADNITKFLGDWWLARVYEAAQEKFHLKDWRATVDGKLQTVNKLYQSANDESDSSRMLTLELLIVLLFVLDLVLLFFSA